MKSDVIAMGFITTKDDAILLRVDSATSQDYMELEIVRWLPCLTCVVPRRVMPR